MSSYRRPGKVRGQNRMSSVALDLNYRDYIDRIGDACALAAMRMAGGVKALSRAANVNDRTIENIIQKRTGANGFTLVKLMTIPEIRSEVKRLAGMESDLDPELERDLTQIINGYVRLKASKAES
jgi:hypothetical protein